MIDFIEQDPIFVKKMYKRSIDKSVFTSNLVNGLTTTRKDLSVQDMSWPMFCVSISFTKESLQLLRRGILHDKCNKQKSIFKVLNHFHRSCFAEFDRYKYIIIIIIINYSNNLFKMDRIDY